MENNWYIQYNGTQVGPMSKFDLLSYGLNPDSMVWNSSMESWQPAYMIPELMKIINQPGSTPLFDSAPGARDRVLAAVLALLFGGFGVQYFYCGKISAGFITIILTAITCGLWAIVMFIQGIYMLTLTDAQFRAKYVDNTATLPLF